MVISDVFILEFILEFRIAIAIAICIAEVDRMLLRHLYKKKGGGDCKLLEVAAASKVAATAYSTAWMHE